MKCHMIWSSEFSDDFIAVDPCDYGCALYPQGYFYAFLAYDVAAEAEFVDLIF